MQHQIEEEKIFPLFSTPLFYKNIKSYNDVNDLNNISKNNFFDNNYQDNTINSIDQNILLNPEYKNLLDIINNEMAKYVYGYLKISTDISLKLVCSWMVIGYPNCKTSLHMHTNSLYSGIFYIKSESDSGTIIFEAPQSQLTYSNPAIKPDVIDYNIYNSLSWSIQPKTNDLLIFPSHLHHRVTENTGTSPRCAIAFNYFLTGMIGSQPTRMLKID